VHVCVRVCVCACVRDNLKKMTTELDTWHGDSS